jgi:AcrR family transcriptional regulator
MSSVAVTPHTRDVIAQHARGLFDQRGYAMTSVRAIAAAAGVDAALVIRYFGSKEDLFLHVTGVSDQIVPELVDGPRDTLGERLVAAVLAPERADIRRTFIAMIRASDYDRVRARLRETTGRVFVDRLARLLEGPDAPLRAQLIGAQLVGIIHNWASMVPDDISESDRARIVQLYGGAVQQLVDAPARRNSASATRKR